MTKQDIINHILKTPSNTNPAVLSGILDDFGSSDNKQEIELSATENKVYTPAEGKVYNKVTVNVPVPELIELTITDTSVTEYTAPEGKAYSKITIASAEPEVEPGE